MKARDWTAPPVRRCKQLTRTLHIAELLAHIDKPLTIREIHKLCSTYIGKWCLRTTNRDISVMVEVGLVTRHTTGKGCSVRHTYRWTGMKGLMEWIDD